MSLPPTVLYVDDYDTSRLGFVCSGFQGTRDVPPKRYGATTVLGRVGELLVTGRPVVEDRLIPVSGTLLAPSVAAREAALDALFERCDRPLVELRFADAPGRVYQAWLVSATVTGIHPQVTEAAVRIDLRFSAPHPYAYKPSGDVIAFGTTPVPVPLGTKPGPAVLTLSGSNSPTVTYRAANGRVVQTLGFTVTLGANDALIVDLDAQTVTRSTAGVLTDGPLPSSGDFFVPDPADGSHVLQSWPTIQVSAGIGELHYRKAYL